MSEDFTIGEDGLPFSTRYGDHYYSRHDGRAEAAHVFFAGNGLPERWLDRKTFTIGELGFGTGLNVLETWRQWRSAPGDRCLTIHSLDAHPLGHDQARDALSDWPELSELADDLLARWDDLDEGADLDPRTRLHVHHLPVVEALARFPSNVDAWFLDGFAPSRNPEMWSAEVMALVASHTAPGGTIASYTAAGWVRRNLADAGFTVEKRPGFGTKRDMIAGRFTP